MSIYANIDTNNIVCQIVIVPEGFTIEQMFVPELLPYMISCDTPVQVGYKYDPETNTFSAPPAPPKTWDNASVRAGLTLADKTKWDNDATPEIKTAKEEFKTPQEVEYTTELLDYLVESQSITEKSRDKILA